MQPHWLASTCVTESPISLHSQPSPQANLAQAPPSTQQGPTPRSLWATLMRCPATWVLVSLRYEASNLLACLGHIIIRWYADIHGLLCTLISTCKRRCPRVLQGWGHTKDLPMFTANKSSSNCKTWELIALVISSWSRSHWRYLRRPIWLHTLLQGHHNVIGNGSALCQPPLLPNKCMMASLTRAVDELGIRERD